LLDLDVDDVDVEIRESVVRRLVAPKLLPPVPTIDPTAGVCRPLTHALSLPIVPEVKASVGGGTGGLYIAEGGDSDRLFLLTARHVVLGPSDTKIINDMFEDDKGNQPPRHILLLDDNAYKDCITAINNNIMENELLLRDLEENLKMAEDQQDKKRGRALRAITMAKEAVEDVNLFRTEVVDNWTTYADRRIGLLAYSPPLGTFEEGDAELFTRDYALIQIDKEKISGSEFKGNVIDLGFKIPSGEFKQRMSSNGNSFEYPKDRLFFLHDAMPSKEICHPFSSKDGLIVMKDGRGSGVTIGRACGIKSFTRLPDSLTVTTSD
jgi:hypothetical protein